MKTPSTELFNLIKSLSVQEKVQFKLYASRKKKQNNYITLFDAIDKQNIYNEVLLKRKFINESFIKNIREAKNYLIEAILKCLQEYYSSDSTDAILCNNIQQIQILANKRLFHLANKLIDKSEKLAIEQDEYYYLSIILYLKRQVLVLEENLEEMTKYSHTHYTNEVKCLETIKNITDYGKLNMQVLSVTYNRSRSDKEYETLKVLLKNPLLKDETKALSFPAKLRHYSLLGDIFLILNDLPTKNYNSAKAVLEKSCLNYEKAIWLMEKAPSYLKNKTDNYMARINNLLVVMTELRKDKEVTLLLNKIKRFMESLPRKLQSENLLKRYIELNSNYISYLLRSLDVHSALKLSETLKPSIEKNHDRQLFLVFHYNLFLTYFYLNDYRKALQEVNEILNTKESEIRQDAIAQIKLLNIMVHHELGNAELLPGLCKSTARYFEKKGPLQLEKKIILNFFGKTILKADTRKERTNAFREFKKELEPVLGKQTSDMFDHISWIESKIENKPFLEVVREKIKMIP